MKRFFLNLLPLLLMLSVSQAQATTYYVATTGSDANSGTQTQPFKTIQRGINAAANGDTVLVADGTYTEAGNRELEIRRTITLRSQGGSTRCTLQCDGRRGIRITGGSAATLIEGFTIQGAASLQDTDDKTGSGAIILNSSPTLRNCVFVLCSVQAVNSTGKGGAVYINNGNPVLINCQFLRNSLLAANTLVELRAAAQGGAIAIEGSSNVKLTNCVFISNVAESITYFDAPAQTESDGGAIYIGAGASATLLHCTLTGNRAWSREGDGEDYFNDYGGAVYLDNGSLTVTNSILYDNTATLQPEISGGGGTVNVTYSDIEGGYIGLGNINADPKFVSVSTPFASDLRLRSDSPCVNTGTASAPNPPAYDLAGFLRQQGIAPDMGAYEQGSSPYIAAHVYVDRASGSDTTGDGSPALPFQTITKALTLADPFFFAGIHIKAGNYGSDRPHVTQKVRFVNWGNVGQASIGKP